MIKKLLTTLMMAIFLVGAVTAPAVAQSQQAISAFDKRIVSRISIDYMMEDLAYLVGLGPRVASSEEEHLAAKFIAQRFEEYGYEVKMQPFEYLNRVAYVTMLSPEQRRIDVRIGGTRTTAPLTPPEGITARVIDCGYGAVGDFSAQVSGNIALIRRGTQTFANMLSRAQAAGAVAVIIQNNSWQIFSVNVAGATIPYATLNEETGELLRGDNVVAIFRAVQCTTSYNVIATKKPKNKNRNSGNIVIFTAHYDSVPTSPGASDNGTGTVGLIELSRIYASILTDTELRFVAVGAEEVGLLGSAYYVSQLSPGEIERTVANYNMDMIGTAGEAQTTLYANVLTGTSNSPGDNLVSFTARSAAERLDYRDWVRMPYYRGASDHVSFYNVGIDAANFIYRDPVTAALEPWYHQPYDTLDRISEERLLMAVEIVAAASHDVVRVETPSLVRSKIRRGVERPLVKEYLDLENPNMEILFGDQK